MFICTTASIERCGLPAMVSNNAGTSDVLICSAGQLSPISPLGGHDSGRCLSDSSRENEMVADK